MFLVFDEMRGPAALIGCKPMQLVPLPRSKRKKTKRRCHEVDERQGAWMSEINNAGEALWMAKCSNLRGWVLKSYFSA